MTRAIHVDRAVLAGVTPAESLASLAATIALGRIETAEDVANAVAFLLSSEGMLHHWPGAECVRWPRISTEHERLEERHVRRLAFQLHRSADIERSVIFYRDVLGFELIHRQEQANEYTRRLVGYPDAHLKVAQFALPGQPRGRLTHDLELLEFVAPRGVRGDIGIPTPALLISQSASMTSRIGTVA